MDGLMNGIYDYQSYYHSTRHDPATEFTIPRSYHIPLGDSHVMFSYIYTETCTNVGKRRREPPCCAVLGMIKEEQPGWLADDPTESKFTHFFKSPPIKQT